MTDALNMSFFIITIVICYYIFYKKTTIISNLEKFNGQAHNIDFQYNQLNSQSYYNEN